MKEGGKQWIITVRVIPREITVHLAKTAVRAFKQIRIFFIFYFYVLFLGFPDYRIKQTLTSILSQSLDQQPWTDQHIYGTGQKATDKSSPSFSASSPGIYNSKITSLLNWFTQLKHRVSA
jgi:hypothetical protein